MKMKDMRHEEESGVLHDVNLIDDEVIIVLEQKKSLVLEHNSNSNS